MLERFLKFVLSERFVIMSLSVILLLSGIYTFRTLDIEAYPDPSPPIIEVIAQNSGWSAEQMEQQVTIPLETVLNGMPGLEHIRSISLFGLSDIKCYFGYGTDYYFDEQQSLNRIAEATLPAGIQPQISPESPVGEIYRYQLTGPYPLLDLKEANDWICVRRFKQVPGVIDVVSWGGPTKEYHVSLDPQKLVAYGVSIPQVAAALQNANVNAGGSYLDIGEQSYAVRGIGLFKTLDDIRNVVVAEKSGTPITIAQLGQVSIGRIIPLGRVGRDGASDIVEGIVLMRKTAKSLPTLQGVEQAAAQMNDHVLPTGMKISPFYDRTDLIHVTTGTVTHVLIDGMLLVALILLAFLGSWRAALIVALTIPLALFFTFLVMVLRGDSANLISLGAIDFGILVDASVVMVENIYRLFSESHPGVETRRKVTLKAAREVAAPIFFSTLIIVAAFLPLFTMTGVEGKIFGPMAVTYGLALLAALFLAFTFSPVAASLFLKVDTEDETALVRWIRGVYSRILNFVILHPWGVTISSLVILICAAAVSLRIGGEFMPKLEEGNLWIRATMPTSISYRYASELTDKMRSVMNGFPEVTTVVSQLGRPEDGTDATGFFNAEFYVPLEPRREWRTASDKDQLIRKMDAALESQFPGIVFNFSQNIEDNVEEAMSGVKGENSIKIFGTDLNKLETLATQVYNVAVKVRGIQDLGIFHELGAPNLLITVDRKAADRYGLNAGDVNGVVQAAVGGQAVTQVLQGDRSFNVVIRFLPEYRATPAAIARIPVATADGGFVPLGEVASIKEDVGAAFIYREDNARYIPIKFSVRGRDLAGTIADADRQVKQAVRFPSGYYLEWTGEFQELQTAVDRLKISVPISFAVIFFLLYCAFRSFKDCLLILATTPLAFVGGIASLLLTGTDFSISAAVGFLSLFGVSVLEGVILISRFKQLQREEAPLEKAVAEGAELRMRPVLMVALSAAIGLFPAAVATGIGSEIQKPLARVVVGGMLTSAALILLVLPALYYLVHRSDKATSREFE